MMIPDQDFYPKRKQYVLQIYFLSANYSNYNMNYYSTPFSSIQAFSKRDVTYQENPQLFERFYAFDPSLEGLQKAIDKRQEYPVDRALLIDSIRNQYKNIAFSPLQADHINALEKETTFTVITAHQPSLLTGPLYYVIKALSAIRLSEELNKKTDLHHIVPVFVIGGEDHDFEEVNHLELFNKSITWENNEIGAVGRMSLSGIDAIIQNVQEILGNSIKAQELIDKIQLAYNASRTYGEFMFRLTNNIFANLGLIVVQMDDKSMKRTFIPQMKKEILERKSESLVLSSQEKIKELGFDPQAHPRDINLFYLSEEGRNRIFFEDNQYRVNNTNLSWTESEIIDELEQKPERFSPNVVLRPIYQESIFPNIAYVGGGGELAYWLERKSQFEHFNVFFPTLVRRKSMLVLDKSAIKSIDKLGINLKDIFLNEHELIDQLILQNEAVEFESELHTITQALEAISTRASSVDKSLYGYSQAEKTKIIKQIQQIETRVKRSVKKKEEIKVNQIKKLKEKLFPNNGLQERKHNYLQFAASWEGNLLHDMYELSNPLDKQFTVLWSKA